MSCHKQLLINERMQVLFMGIYIFYCEMIILLSYNSHNTFCLFPLTKNRDSWTELLPFDDGNAFQRSVDVCSKASQQFIWNWHGLIHSFLSQLGRKYPLNQTCSVRGGKGNFRSLDRASSWVFGMMIRQVSGVSSAERPPCTELHPQVLQIRALLKVPYISLILLMSLFNLPK